MMGEVAELMLMAAIVLMMLMMMARMGYAGALIACIGTTCGNVWLRPGAAVVTSSGQT